MLESENRKNVFFVPMKCIYICNTNAMYGASFYVLYRYCISIVSACYVVVSYRYAYAYTLSKLVLLVSMLYCWLGIKLAIR